MIRPTGLSSSGFAGTHPDSSRCPERREAVLSSQIEGTQSSLDDVLAYELDTTATRLPLDVEEVFNHVAAMNYGLERLATLPLSLRLIREIHERLTSSGVRSFI